MIRESTPAPSSFSSPGLGKLLVRLEICEKRQLDELSQISTNTKVVAALSKRYGVDEISALEKIASDLSIPLLSLKDKPANMLATSLLTQDFAILHRCIPVEETADSVLVALADPLDVETLSKVEFTLQKSIEVALATESEILYVAEKFFNDDDSGFAEEYDRLEGLDTSVEVVVDSSAEKEGEAEGSKAAPIIRLVNKVLADATKVGASDIHLEPTSKQLDVRFRVDGIMATRLSIPKRLQPYVTTRIKILAGMNITEKRRPQDGSFRMRTGKYSTRDVRASAVPTPYGEKLVLRLLRSDFEGLDFQTLGLEPQLIGQLEQILSSPDKIILVTGPTGSGKSTTLYAALQFVRRGTNNIITVEDPIEFRIPGITQIQVDSKVGIDFASGLRSMLRQDPDVILVGEIRDLETAEIAFQAAQTGHLVLSTLHTNDAVSAVVRLRDLGLEPFVIAASLGGVLAQRLLRKLCVECSKLSSDAVRAEKERELNSSFLQLKTAVGCAHCNGSGYRGRVGAYSFLPISAAFREAIRTGAGDEVLLNLAQQQGMEELFYAGLRLVSSGVTSLEELERVLGKIPVSTKGAEKPVKSDSKSVAELVADYQEGKDRPKRVLLVDDDDGVRVVMAMSLEKAGFEVRSVSGGLEALNSLDDFLPDVVVLDLMMPGMDGKEALLKIRENAMYTELPVLMLTALDDEESEIALINAGANDYVSKASSPSLVLTRIKRLIS